MQLIYTCQYSSDHLISWTSFLWMFLFFFSLYFKYSFTWNNWINSMKFEMMILRKINFEIIWYSVIFAANLYLSMFIIWFLELCFLECCHPCYHTHTLSDNRRQGRMRRRDIKCETVMEARCTVYPKQRYETVIDDRCTVYPN